MLLDNFNSDGFETAKDRNFEIKDYNSFYQNELFIDKDSVKKMYTQLKKVFPICSTYTSNIPTYPGGYWAWAFCSESVKPLSYFDEERCEEITKTCKIYNKDYHMARFALPNYLKELL